MRMPTRWVFSITRSISATSRSGDWNCFGTPAATGLFVVVVKAECRYQKPARYDDLLTVRTTLSKISAAKIQHDYVLLRDGEQLATATVTLAVVNREGQVQRVPEWIQEIY